MLDAKSLYKVVSEMEWRLAADGGIFMGSEVDHRDGFIHLSTGAQVEETVARHFAGQTELLLVEVDASKLGDSLRWETSRDDKLFPHVYGSLPMNAVVRVDELLLGEDGKHKFPD